MKKKNNKSDSKRLRRQAEKRLERNKQKESSPATPEELQRLVHELEVHQLELQMQNDELYQARSELEASLERYTNFYDYAPVGYFILEPSGAIQKANLTGAYLLGVQRNRLLTQPFSRFISADSRLTFNYFLEKVFRSQAKETCVVTLSNVGNAPLCVHIEARVSENGQECRIAVFDVTASKHVEARLKQSEHEKNVILSTMAEKVVYHDNKMKIRWANRAACEFFQMIPEEVEGKICQEILSRRMEDCQGCPVTKVLETGHYYQDTLKYSDGKTLLISAHPVSDSDGGLTGVVEVSQDITERVRMEAELTKAKEECAAASGAKSSFLSYMSHEMRTPMNVIIGMANLVYESVHSREDKEYIDMIRDSAAFLLNLINRILDLSKIEAGMFELEHVHFNLRREVEKTVSSFDLDAEKKCLELSCSIDDNVPKLVTGDPTRLQQVLVNLIGNAIKFTEQGAVDISLRQVETDVLFFISDTGVGIQPEKIDRLFNVFTQIDTFGMRKYEGTGLGLAISKNLVELMGGSIGVESVENRGSTFYFTIPFAPFTGMDDITDTNVFGKPVESLPEQPLLCGKKVLEILLVEDKPMNQKLATVLLEKKGHKVTTAINGREALDTLRSQLFDLILMDIHMPEMDGLEATARIRAFENETVRRIPIIAMTAFAMKEDRDKCLQAGMDYYVSKPINTKELYSALAKVMEGSSH